MAHTDTERNIQAGGLGGEEIYAPGNKPGSNTCAVVGFFPAGNKGIAVA